MPAFRSTTITSAALLTLVVGCVGCDGHAKEKETGTAGGPTHIAVSDEGGSDGGGASADPTTEVQVAPPDPRDYPGMDEQTEQGAQQAFRYFWAAVIYGYRTGKTELFAPYETASCNYCRELAVKIEDKYSKGARWGETGIEDRALETEGSYESGFAVGYSFVLTAHTEMTDDTATERLVPEKLYASVGEMIWENNRWKVRSLDMAS